MACHPERKLKHHCGWKHWPCPDTRHFLALKHCLLTVLQHSWMNLHFPGKMLKYVLMGLGPWLSWTEMQAHVWNWNVPCGFHLSRRPAKWKCSLQIQLKHLYTSIWVFPPPHSHGSLSRKLFSEGKEAFDAMMLWKLTGLVTTQS